MTDRMSREELAKIVENLPEDPAEDKILDQFLGPDAEGNGDEEVLSAAMRTPRSSETREKQVHDSNTWLPRSSFPEPQKIPGWSYRWIRIGYGTRGGDDAVNVMGRMREGWVVVPPSEQPEIASTLPSGGKGQERIVVADQILMRIPDEAVEARRKYYASRSKGQVSGLQSQLLNIQDARMPLLRPSIVSTTSKRMQG